MDVKFKRDPGLIYDIISMLIMKLNPKEKWVSTVVNSSHENGDLTYYNYWMDQFDEPDQRLLLFVYRKDTRALTFLSIFFKDQLKKNSFQLDLDIIFQELNDADTMFQKIFHFYLQEEASASIRPAEVAEKIYNRNDLSDDIRFFLLNFSVNKKPYIDCLKELITNYYNQFCESYGLRANELLLLHENLYMPDLQKIMSLHLNSSDSDAEIEHQWNSLKTISISFCLFMKNGIWITLLDDAHGWCILGQNYAETLLIDINFKISPEAIGNAIGDRHRERIVGIILEHGEQSSGDIAKKLGLALNTVTYHLDIMKKANLLCSRNQGKSTFYWINSKTCEEASRMFKIWARGGVIHEDVEEADHANCI